uniref:Gamma-secretase subunit PEN-2 n=1 Tax=Rhabditophanes sp. KR3021 TaxID=114890 RepID=A0AC35TKZ5_9BILA
MSSSHGNVVMSEIANLDDNGTEAKLLPVQNATITQPTGGPKIYENNTRDVTDRRETSDKINSELSQAITYFWWGFACLPICWIFALFSFSQLTCNQAVITDKKAIAKKYLLLTSIALTGFVFVASSWYGFYYFNYRLGSRWTYTFAVTIPLDL